MASLTLPRLTALPLELLLHIISYLTFDDCVKFNKVCRFYHAIIPTPTLKELLAIETEDWALEKQLLACSGCVRLRKSCNFSCNMLSRSTRRSMELFPKDRRLCYACSESGFSLVPFKLRCRGCGSDADKVDGDRKSTRLNSSHWE